MNDPTTPQRFILEKEHDFYLIRDSKTNDLLPFKSRVRAEMEQMAERLNANYEQYVRNQASLM